MGSLAGPKTDVSVISDGEAGAYCTVGFVLTVTPTVILAANLQCKPRSIHTLLKLILVGNLYTIFLLLIYDTNLCLLYFSDYFLECNPFRSQNSFPVIGF